MLVRLSVQAKRITEERAALRHVATLVARNTPEAEVFAAIADSVAELFGTDDVFMMRFDGDRGPLVVASSGRFSDAFPVGSDPRLSVTTSSGAAYLPGSTTADRDGPTAQAAAPSGSTASWRLRSSWKTGSGAP